MVKIPWFKAVLPLLFLWPQGMVISWGCAFHASFAFNISSGSLDLEDKVFRKETDSERSDK